MEENILEGNIWPVILALVVIIIVRTFYSGALAAINELNDTKLEKLAADGDKRAKRLKKLTSSPSRLTAIDVTVSFLGFILSATAAYYFAEPIAELIRPKVPESIQPVLGISAVIVLTLVMSFFTVLISELVPKSIARIRSEKMALGASGLLLSTSSLLKPIAWLHTASANVVLRILGIDPSETETDVSEEDIHDIVDSAAKSGSIDDEERDFIQNVFEFDDLTAGEIATHRTDVQVLWLDETDEEWSATIHDNCHMFYPVCKESADDVVGVLFLKDYFRLEERTRENVLEKAVKTPYFVPESVKADVLFRNMKTGGKIFAVVLDEYGGMRGILTMNDLISRLVGDFGGEEPIEEGKTADSIERIGEHSWRIVGNVSISEIADEIGVTLPDEDFETFSGMIFAELGSIPDDGETFEISAWGLDIKVTSVVEHQIVEAELTVLEPTVDDDEE